METSSSPSHMTDVPIVNEDVNAPTTTSVASTASSNDSNTTPPTTQDTTQEISQDISQDTSKVSSNSPKRKYNKRIPKEDPPRRRTRNTSKAAINPISTPQEDEPSNLATRRPSSASSSRRGTTSSNVEHVERQLPSKEGINQSNISDRFVEFIMYCNPLAPENLDKVALVRSFNAVPKSDGKVFQTWTLYQLVDKHYAGEIRTWTKLAQKLGVVRTPEASPQKIQQYAVRLKKWMASVHVDAYFDYLLSRPNDYYQLPQRNPTDASDDESDVVLKLIKRAGSKRQKRKYTRRNTNTSNTSANDDGTTNPEGVSRGNTTELDDEAHFESEEVDEGADKHRVQVGYCQNWVKDYVKEEESENIVGGVRKEANPENDSSRYYRQYPSQFALIEPKNGSNIPTPNPSPTTLPVMSLSSGNITGNKRVLSHSGATGGAGTQLRWRISTGPVHAVKSSADESYLTTSPSSSQKDQSKKKQEPVQTLPPGQTVLDLRQPPMAPQPILPSNDKETITMLQKNLVSAIGMLEDSQRKIKMLNDLVRQREDDVRQRVVRALKTEVNTVIEKFQ
ncbi:14357_t:CDS:2 [Rhizophagus irregularis]|nr:14357_t:CDS:2 [Rhizophagus irregularis]